MDAALPFRTWLTEGLRAAFFLRPATGNARARPGQFVGLLVLLVAIDLGLSRAGIAGPADFEARVWLASWWATALGILVAWWVLAGTQRPFSAWLALSTAAAIPTTVAGLSVLVAQAWGLLDALPEDADVVFYILLAIWAWGVAVQLWLARQFGGSGRGLAMLGAASLATMLVATFYFPTLAWAPAAPRVAEAEPERLLLTQESIEAQQAAAQLALDAIAPQRPGVIDVYGLVFAPYAPEDVFLRESTMVAKLLADRFDAKGRVVHLVNHARTVATHAWATPENVRRAVDILAQRMDPAEDVLVIYMTSHGANDFRLAAAHPPLGVAEMTPRDLREALDAAGIRYRVIAISACFSGGWVGPLGDPSTLVMTAADPTHTSYGCGRLSELTFFGRAVFDEQLRKTHSFEKAFAAAVPVIRQREEQARKEDGFSNPQISVGEKIAPVLRALEERLAQAAPAVPAAAEVPVAPASGSAPVAAPASAPAAAPASAAASAPARP